MEFAVPLDSPFSLDYTLDSGQVFRWRRAGGWWYGVVSGGVVKVKQEGDVLKCSTSSDGLDSAFVSSYFRLDDDLEHVLATIMKDDRMTRAVERFYGMRLVKQDRWECLASFVLATNANIPRIQKMVSEISSKYGREIVFEGESYHAFPAPGDLAEAKVSNLRECGLGYRAPFIKKVASEVTEGRVEFERIAALPYEEAKSLLLGELLGEKVLLGVGPKVADCALLYSFGKDEAFPMDVWIARAVFSGYPRLLSPSLRAKLKRGMVKLSAGDYAAASTSMREYFGKYAGYAQQYLFMAARESGA